jgi:hypothetical protein
MYDDPTFEPSAAETVMVHMLFAIMFFNMQHGTGKTRAAIGLEYPI